MDSFQKSPFFSPPMSYSALGPVQGFPGGSEMNNRPANAGDTGVIPGVGKISGEGRKPLQYSCLGNPMDRGACLWGLKRIRHDSATKPQPGDHAALSLLSPCVGTVLNYVWLCDPMDPPGSSVHGIFQARILEWVAISYSRGSSRPRDRTCVSHVSFTGRQNLYHHATWASFLSPPRLLSFLWSLIVSQLSYFFMTLTVWKTTGQASRTKFLNFCSSQ